MKSILDEIEIVDVNHLKIDDFEDNTVVTKISIEEAPVRYEAPNTLRTYKAGLHIATTFSCSDEDYEAAVCISKKRLKHYLFADLKSSLRDILSAAYSGDKATTLKLLQELMDEYE
jgi:hypothetical protein